MTQKNYEKLVDEVEKHKNDTWTSSLKSVGSPLGLTAMFGSLIAFYGLIKEDHAKILSIILLGFIIIMILIIYFFILEYDRLKKIIEAFNALYSTTTNYNSLLEEVRNERDKYKQEVFNLKFELNMYRNFTSTEILQTNKEQN